MKVITDTILSGKYRLCQELGKGHNSIVYLAVHQELEEYRAVKCISRASTDYQRFLREAHMLRDLRHPGIPVVYDLAEDETFSYLIEEYLSGDTLWTIVSRQGSLSRAMTIQYGIQICRLVYFLHSRPNPILFLDLQPQNLLLCNGVLKLIDFGQAVCAADARQLTERYGTVGYAAPEQYSKETLDERTDLYAIGAVLYFMYTGTSPGMIPSYSGQQFDAALERLLRKCLASAKQERYRSAAELEHELKKLALAAGDGVNDQAVLSLTIAFAGVKAGAGTTHGAIGMAAFFMQCGISCLYEEKNSSGAVRRLADWFGAEPDKYGCVQIKGVQLRQSYGPAVHLAACECSVVIQDYGTEWSAIKPYQADAVILICGSRWWEQELANDACEALGAHPGFTLIYNHISGQNIILPSKADKARCFPMPYFPDPFQIDSQTQKYYQTVIKTTLNERGGIETLCCQGSFLRNAKGKLSAWKRKLLGL